MKSDKMAANMVKKMTVLAVAFVIMAISAPLCADTIFVGIEGAGVEQLREDLQVGAIGNLDEAAEHIAISGTDRLYCAFANKVAVLDPAKLSLIDIITMPGRIVAMEMENGILYLLVEGPPAQIVLISDVSQKIRSRIDLSKIIVPVQMGYGYHYAEPVDMAVTSGGKKIFLAMPLKSRVDVITIKDIYTGYGRAVYGELIASIDCGGNPCSLALSKDERKLYVADSESRVISGKASSRVVVIDASWYKVMKNIPVGRECIKVCSVGSAIYALNRSPLLPGESLPFLGLGPFYNSWPVHVIETSQDSVINVIMLKSAPSDAASGPEGDYSIVVSRAGDMLYKINKAKDEWGVDTFQLIDEKPLPGPRSVRIIKETLGEPPVVYSAGTEIQGTAYSFSPEVSTQTLLAPLHTLSDVITVTVIYPNGFESPTNIQKLSGIQFVQWQTDPRLNPLTSNAKVTAIVDGTEYDLHVGWIQNTQLFEWDTSQLEIDSRQYKIKVYVIDNTIIDPVYDISDYNFAVDNTPPEVDILQDEVTSSTSITVRAHIEDAMFDIPLATIVLTVNGSEVAGSPTPLADDIYEWTGVSILGGGEPNTIEVTAQDEAGNEGSDSVDVVVGWVMHVEFPHTVPYEVNNPANSSAAAVCQMILDLMRQGKEATFDVPSQNVLYDYGRPFNYFFSTPELEPVSIAFTLGYFDPWDPEPYPPNGNQYYGYNFQAHSHDPMPYPDVPYSLAYEYYLRDIVLLLGYTVPVELGYPELVDAPNVPVAVPIYGDYNWVAINGAATDVDPYVSDPIYGPYGVYADIQDFTLYGMWFTDPDVDGIGQDFYVAYDDLDTYLQPLNRPGEHYDGDYVSVVEPPMVGTMCEVRAPEPQVNDSTLALVEIAERYNTTSDPLERHLIDSALVVDLDETGSTAYHSLSAEQANLFRQERVESTPAICWKEILPPPLLSDKKFRDAINGARAREFLFVTRADTGEEYIVIPFDKRIERQYQTIAAIIVDRKLGYVKQATRMRKPTAYREPKREEIIEIYRSLYPDQDVDARLMWRPGRRTRTPFHPYWEVSAGDRRLYIMRQRSEESR